jgi:secondary thiamine-phosphate synthase enzyme
MRMAQGLISVTTRGQGLYEVTAEVSQWLAKQGVHGGLLTLFVRHTSASLLVQENAAPDVRADLNDFFRRLVPEDLSLYRHDEEGADDMPAHIRSALMPTSLSLPCGDGRLLLGKWQGVFLFEHRHQPHHREIVLHLVGE